MYEPRDIERWTREIRAMARRCDDGPALRELLSLDALLESMTDETIRRLHDDDGFSLRELARECGTTHVTLGSRAARATRRHLVNEHQGDEQ